MVIIHHQCFPHLIDNIWRELDFHDLRVARLVCKDWARRVDGLLNHISVEHRNDGSLQFRTLDSSKSVHFHTVRTSILPAGSAWLSLMAKVQVLDIFGADSFLSLQRLWLQSFVERIPLIRWHGTPSTSIDSPNIDTLLFFQEISGPSVPSVTLGYTQPHPLHVVSTVRCLVDPLRLTLPDSPHAINFYGWDGCTESVTLILQDERPPPRQPPPTCADASIDVVMTYLNIVAVESAYIYIVGLEAFLPDLDEWPAFREKVARQFRQENDDTDEPWSDDDEEFTMYWRFLTHDQYREQVGDLRYKMHTQR